MSSSIVVDFTYPKRMYRVTITPEMVNSRIEAQHLTVYTAMFNNEGYYEEAEDAEISINETTGAITVEFSKPIFSRFMKLHCHFNELDSQGNSVNTLDSFMVSGSDAVEAIALVGGRNEFYIYDDKGNRSKKTIMSDGFDMTDYVYYADSDLIKTDGNYYYNYDANGNMIEKGTLFNESSSDVVNPDPEEPLFLSSDSSYEYTRYDYDLKNRLQAVYRYNAETETLEEVASYTYDIDGYRIAKTGNSGTIHYIFDLSGKVLEEVKGDEVTSYVFIKERHLARIAGEETLFYGTDHLNSTLLITDAEGNEVWNADVTPFGDYARGSDEEYTVKYTGKDRDEDTGLYYFNARWYDAEAGRFINEDPIRDGLNWYSYCSNNPINFVDPTGLLDVTPDSYATFNDLDDTLTMATDAAGYSSSFEYCLL
ncbi:MAG: RHS repeat-associated core domain-containing protein, partial [Spirochaetaceae bacterium]|nr:RHS repeat-associated core domain-containing protein [Spirochaetaceae bacterium]